MRVALAILFVLVMVALGIWLDIFWLLIGGIEEIARGAQQHPSSSHDIAYGIVRVVCSGIFTVVGVIIGFVGAAAIMEWGD